jgi:acetyl esterase/lipase
MPSEELAQIIETLRARPPAAGLTVADDRAMGEERSAALPLEDDISCRRISAGGVPAEWVSAPGVSEDHTVLYLHGGGYVTGSVRSSRVVMSRISRAAGVRSLGLDYRLAPEHPFPAAVEDSVAAYQWLLSNGGDPSKTVVAGASAGAGLTLATLVALRYLGEPMPAAGICMSAWSDLALTLESWKTNAEADPTITRDRIAMMATAYVGDRDPKAPLASPFYADLSGLPPLLLQVGSIETLLDDSVVLAKRAEEAGVDVTLEVWDGCPHVWQSFAPVLPEGQQAVERIGEFIKDHVG